MSRCPVHSLGWWLISLCRTNSPHFDVKHPLLKKDMVRGGLEGHSGSSCTVWIKHFLLRETDDRDQQNRGWKFWIIDKGNLATHKVTHISRVQGQRTGALLGLRHDLIQNHAHMHATNANETQAVHYLNMPDPLVLTTLAAEEQDTNAAHRVTGKIARLKVLPKDEEMEYFISKLLPELETHLKEAESLKEEAKDWPSTARETHCIRARCEVPRAVKYCVWHFATGCASRPLLKADTITSDINYDADPYCDTLKGDLIEQLRQDRFFESWQFLAVRKRIAQAEDALRAPAGAQGGNNAPQSGPFQVICSVRDGRATMEWGGAPITAPAGGAGEAPANDVTPRPMPSAKEGKLPAGPKFELTYNWTKPSDAWKEWDLPRGEWNGVECKALRWYEAHRGKHHYDWWWGRRGSWRAGKKKTHAWNQFQGLLLRMDATVRHRMSYEEGKYFPASGEEGASDNHLNTVKQGVLESFDKAYKTFLNGKKAKKCTLTEFITLLKDGDKIIIQ